MIRSLLLTLLLAGCAETTAASRPLHPGGSVGGLAAQYAQSGGGYATGDYYSADTLILSQPGTRIDPNATFNFHSAQGSTPQSTAFLNGFQRGAMPKCLQPLLDSAYLRAEYTKLTGYDVRAVCPGQF